MIVDALDVKNGVPIERALPAATAGLLQLWLDDYRPRLAKPGCPWLFPGGTAKPLCKSHLRKWITRAIRDYANVEVHPHLFRHFCAWLHLQYHPGDYEGVRRLLGHKRIETAIKSYIAFEQDVAAARYDKAVLKERQASQAHGESGAQPASRQRLSATGRKPAMPKTTDPRRRWRRLHEWPAPYRALWLAATAPGDDLDMPTYGRSLRPASRDTFTRNFGRWLSFLDGRGELDDRVPPEVLVTPARIAAYLRELKDMNYSAQSIILALSAISVTMRILAPAQDWRWIWRPNGEEAVGVPQRPAQGIPRTPSRRTVPLGAGTAHAG